MSGQSAFPVRPLDEAPVLDLCVPYWGAPADLRETVESVLAQDDPNWRLVVLDDCYPEDVAPWFETLDDDRVTYTRHEQNVGVTENYRRAIAAAKGPRVVILGSDDVLHPNYVRIMRDVMVRHPDVDVVQPGVQVIDGDGAPILPLADRVKQKMLMPKKPTTLRGEQMATSLLTGNWLYWPSLMFRTDTVRRIGFRDGLPIIQDLALMIDIAFEGGSLHFVPDVCFSYRRHGQSLSQTSIADGSRFRDERRFYQDTAEAAAARGWTKAARAARLRIMSRFHGVVTLPKVVRGGTPESRRSVLSLTFAR